MSTDLHTIETAPDASKPLLEAAEKENGFIPNILRVLADSPVALSGYLHITNHIEEPPLDETFESLRWKKK